MKTDWDMVLGCLFAASVIISIVAALYFGAVYSAERTTQRQANCLESGGSWIPVANNDTMCLRLK